MNIKEIRAAVDEADRLRDLALRRIDDAIDAIDHEQPKKARRNMMDAFGLVDRSRLNIDRMFGTKDTKP